MICDEDGKARPCHHNHRTHEAAQECSLREERRRIEAVRAAEVQLISGMSKEEYLRTEEYLRAAKADPVCREELRRLTPRARQDSDGPYSCSRRSISGARRVRTISSRLFPAGSVPSALERGAQAAAPCTRPGRRGLEHENRPRSIRAASPGHLARQRIALTCAAVVSEGGAHP
jgi:hypothetical protein